MYAAFGTVYTVAQTLFRRTREVKVANDHIWDMYIVIGTAS
jgi:hypothetical protein